MIGPRKLEEVVEKASTAFWVEVAKQLPDIEAKELDAGTYIVLQWQMKIAIEQWIQQNLMAMEKSENDFSELVPNGNETIHEFRDRIKRTMGG